jgi:hypothetical protein
MSAMAPRRRSAMILPEWQAFMKKSTFPASPPADHIADHGFGHPGAAQTLGVTVAGQKNRSCRFG